MDLSFCSFDVSLPFDIISPLTVKVVKVVLVQGHDGKGGSKIKDSFQIKDVLRGQIQDK